MKFTIITAVLNNKDHIEECIRSVLQQTYKNIEYIVVDGGSTDGTLEIIGRYKGVLAQFVSEPDRGIYDAMNKGIRLASGDIVGMLNSDDFYVNSGIISLIADEFKSKMTDSVFADLVFVKREDSRKVVRYYDSSSFTLAKFAYGWMPAHPTFFVKRVFYEKYGLFKTDYKIAADYELLVRLLGKHGISYSHIPEVVVKMRTGGVSTRNLRSNWTLNREIMRACAENGIKTNIFKVFSKYPTKVFQLLNKPK